MALVAAEGLQSPAPGRPAGRLESQLIIAGYLLYIGGLTALLVVHGRYTPAPDLLIVGLLPLALLMRRGKAFLLDWTPFLMILLAYEETRGLATRISGAAHISTVITWETRFFGNPIPTLRLQAWLEHSSLAGPIDIVSALLYIMHFVVPLALAFWLWKASRKRYWNYVVGLVLISYAGCLTFVLYPQAPPWLAANQGYLPAVHRIFVDTLQHFLLYRPLYSAFEHLDTNLVAAMPSLHIAYPTYSFLVIQRVMKRRWTRLLVFYPLAVSFAVVYMGEHYVMDCVAGAAYGVAGFWLVWDAPSLFTRWMTWLQQAVHHRAVLDTAGGITAISAPIAEEQRTPSAPRIAHETIDGPASWSLAPLPAGAMSPKVGQPDRATRGAAHRHRRARR